MLICCNCKKESLLQLHICPDCLNLLRDIQREFKLQQELLQKASKLLKDTGFVEESKALDFRIKEGSS